MVAKANNRNSKKKVETSIQAAQPQEIFTTIKHSCNLGDIISSLPCVKKYWQLTGRRIMFCQAVNTPAAYYQGATHPTTDENGNMVCVNNKMFEMIKPLIESQPYIHSFVKYEGQHIDLNFDVIRGQTDVGMPNFMIQSWLMFAFPDLHYDLSKTWMELPEVENHQVKKIVEGKVIINFTERYRLPPTQIDYFFLRHYAPDLMFAGTEAEHFKFCTRWNLNIPRLEVNDFLEYAYALKYSRFLMSNQSMAWNLASGLGTKRLLEVCKWAANCQPYIGDGSYGYFYQVACEHYFRQLYNETK